MKDKQNKIIISLLIVIIAILLVFIILLITNVITFNFKNNDMNNKELNEDVISYREYKIYDEITLNDGSKWIVIEESSDTSDYVTLIKKEAIDISDNDTYYLLQNEFFSEPEKVTYDDSNLKIYLKNFSENIPVTLKEVNGYKIRLITIDEIFAIDKNWSYDEDNDTYMYLGNDSDLLFAGLTMTETKCTKERKCSSFYVQNHYMSESNKKFSLDRWASGEPQIKPVINVYKTEIE